MYPIKIKAHDRNVNIVRLNYDGDLIFSGGPGDKQNPSINVFEAFTGERLGSYVSRAAIKSLDVDIDSKYLICTGFDGTLEMFDVRTGASVLWSHFPESKGKHLEFALGSKKFLFLYDYYSEEAQASNSAIKVIDYSTLVALKPESPDDEVNYKRISHLSQFSIYFDKDVKCTAERAVWFVDNKSMFLGTNKGEVVHFSETGEQLNRGVIHKDGQIKAVAFSQDFSILGTAGTDGCKIVDPITMEVLRFFKQEYPMNAVSISPLFCSQTFPKYHCITGGGIKSSSAATSKGAGFEAHVCNVMDGVEIGKISTHFGPINSMEFLKDGKGYVTGSEDSYVTIVRFDQSYYDNPKFE